MTYGDFIKRLNKGIEGWIKDILRKVMAAFFISAGTTPYTCLRCTSKGASKSCWSFYATRFAKGLWAGMLSLSQTTGWRYCLALGRRPEPSPQLYDQLTLRVACNCDCISRISASSSGE